MKLRGLSSLKQRKSGALIEIANSGLDCDFVSRLKRLRRSAISHSGASSRR